MLRAESALIFHFFKYSETSLILKLFTRESGLRSVIYKGAKRKKNQSVQPLSMVTTEYYFKEGKDLGTVKSVSLAQPYQSIYADVRKSSVVLFIQELLYKTIREEEPNPELYDFVVDFLTVYDQTSFNVNAHLWFALHLTDYFGIRPDTDTYLPGTILNLEEGCFEHASKMGVNCANVEQAKVWSKILGTKFDALSELKISNETRREVLQTVIDYYELQLTEVKTIHSHLILRELLQ